MLLHYKKCSLKRYKREAVSLLRDFCVRVTPEIREEINKRTSEISIDNYCNDLIRQKLERKY